MQNSVAAMNDRGEITAVWVSICAVPFKCVPAFFYLIPVCCTHDISVGWYAEDVGRGAVVNTKVVVGTVVQVSKAAVRPEDPFKAVIIHKNLNQKGCYKSSLTPAAMTHPSYIFTSFLIANQITHLFYRSRILLSIWYIKMKCQHEPLVPMICWEPVDDFSIFFLSQTHKVSQRANLTKMIL